MHDVPQYDIGDSILLTCSFLTRPTKGTIEKGASALTVQDTTGYLVNDTVLVVGAGAVDSEFVTTISVITGSVFTLAAAAQDAVIAALVGKLTNPTSVTLRVKQPDGTISTPAASNPSIGKWQGTFDPTQTGEHWYRFEGTGAAKGAAERRFLVVEKRA